MVGRNDERSPKRRRSARAGLVFSLSGLELEVVAASGGGARDRLGYANTRAARQCHESRNVPPATDGETAMGNVIEIDDALWARLSTAARRGRETPRRLVQKLIQEFLEADVDRKMDAAIAKEARQSGYREEDAVPLVRQYRSKGVSRQPRRVGEPAGGYRRARRT